MNKVNTEKAGFMNVVEVVGNRFYGCFTPGLHLVYTWFAGSRRRPTQQVDSDAGTTPDSACLVYTRFAPYLRPVWSALIKPPLVGGIPPTESPGRATTRSSLRMRLPTKPSRPPSRLGGVRGRAQVLSIHFDRYFWACVFDRCLASPLALRLTAGSHHQQYR
jgi:hypothetical protein